MLLWEHSEAQRLLTVINSTSPFYHRYFARPFFDHEMHPFMGIYTFFIIVSSIDGQEGLSRKRQWLGKTNTLVQDINNIHMHYFSTFLTCPFLLPLSIYRGILAQQPEPSKSEVCSKFLNILSGSYLTESKSKLSPSFSLPPPLPLSPNLPRSLRHHALTTKTSWLLLKHTKHTPTAGLLHLFSTLPGLHFLKLSIRRLHFLFPFGFLLS